MTIFGRRTINQSKYVVPPQMWADPKSAGFLERIGHRPNDPDNIRVTPEDVARMMEEGRKSVRAKIEETQAKLAAKGFPHSPIRPFWMLQDNCWNGPCGDMLLYWFGFNPYDGWNSVLLPTDPTVATLLKVAVHPGGNVPLFAATGADLLLKLRQELLDAKAEAEKTAEFGRFADTWDDAKAKVKRLAFVLNKRMTDAAASAPDGLWYKRLTATTG